MSLTCVGDVHGWTDRYVRAVKDLPASIQVGDMAHNYSRLAELDPSYHRFIGGNHDNYDYYYQQPHSLGDYGVAMIGGVEFFFVRGAYSIDRVFRTPQKDWWPEEEIKASDLLNAVNLYGAIKPQVVISHDCPKDVSDIIGNPQMLRDYGFDPETFTTRTQQALQCMFEFHQPTLWLFGHYHRSRQVMYNNTLFVCLNELETFEINDKCLRLQN